MLRSKLWLVAVFYILIIGLSLTIGVLFYSNRTTPRMRTPLDGVLTDEKEKRYELLNTSPPEVSELIVRRRALRDIIFKPEEGYESSIDHWHLAEPKLDHVDMRKVSNSVGRILTMRLEGLISSPVDDPAAYGFDNPYMIVTAKLKDGNYRLFAVGNRVSGEVSRYVYTPQTQTVGILKDGLLVLERQAESFYPNEVVGIDPATIRSFQIQDLQSGQSLHLAYQPDDSVKPWIIEKSEGFGFASGTGTSLRVNQANVQDLATGICFMQRDVLGEGAQYNYDFQYSLQPAYVIDVKDMTGKHCLLHLGWSANGRFLYGQREGSGVVFKAQQTVADSLHDWASKLLKS